SRLESIGTDRQSCSQLGVGHFTAGANLYGLGRDRSSAAGAPVEEGVGDAASWRDGALVVKRGRVEPSRAGALRAAPCEVRCSVVDGRRDPGAAGANPERLAGARRAG